MKHTAKTYRPLAYYLITFTITIVLWTIGAMLSHDPETSDLSMSFMLPGLLAPFLVSLVFIFASRKKVLRRDFLNRLFDVKRIDPKMLIPIFLLMPLVMILSILISLLFGGDSSQFQLSAEFSFSAGFVPVLLLLMIAALFEELGWRGYAFDSLHSRFSYLKASLIFSVLWSLWHSPLIFFLDSYQYEVLQQSGLYALNFFVSIIPMGMIISWVCIRNRRSVASAVLFHFIINMTQEMFQVTQDTKCIETFVLAGVALVIFLTDPKMREGAADAVNA